LGNPASLARLELLNGSEHRILHDSALAFCQCIESLSHYSLDRPWIRAAADETSCSAPSRFLTTLDPPLIGLGKPLHQHLPTLPACQQSAGAGRTLGARALQFGDRKLDDSVQPGCTDQCFELAHIASSYASLYELVS
jgi:hypothetical protein